MFNIVFDDLMIKQLGKVDNSVKIHLSKMVRKLNKVGPRAGKLLDHHVFLYEVKMKRPPIRLYYHVDTISKIILLVDIDLKKGSEQQKDRIKKLVDYLKSNVITYLSQIFKGISFFLKIFLRFN